MTYARDVDEWPLILCGPMLRRVMPQSVAVFVALSREASVELRVGRRGEREEDGVALCSGTSSTLPLGRRLHVCVVVASMPAGQLLAPGLLYEYDIRLTTTEGEQGLKQLGLLDMHHPLGYEAGRLPTFALPPGLSDLQLIHGSCRKPSGEGDDMLVVADSMLTQSWRDPLQRAHQLLLTGDQIYADDVAPSLLIVFQDTAALLLDWSEPERLRLTDGSASLTPDDPRLAPGPARKEFDDWHKPYDPTTVATRQRFSNYRTRMEFMFTQTDFSSLECDAHLIFLGEFYAHYLMAWSPELWPRDAAGGLLLPDAEQIRSRWGAFSETVGYTLRQKDYMDEAQVRRASALACGAGIAKVRRLLANVPTSMIFDDHEVTDDWNLHRAWNENVMSNRAGRQIIRNGLVAYSLFQDWGNVPERYEAGPGASVHAAARMDLAELKPALLGQPDALDATLNLVPWTSRAFDLGVTMQWDHVAYGPEHQILFLDARNWRAFDAGVADAKAAPRLIEEVILNLQFDTARLQPGLALIVVAPAPVFGITPIEWLQERVSNTNIDTEVLKFVGQAEERDRESWTSNEGGFALLMERLVVFERAVLLSGDVHYAFAKQAAFFRRTQAGHDRARIIQLCCSSLKNEIFKTRLVHRIGRTPISSPFASQLTPQEYAPWQELRTRVELHFQQAMYAVANGDPLHFEMLSRTYQEIRLANLLGEPLSFIAELGPEYEAAQQIIEAYSSNWATSKAWTFRSSGVLAETDLQVLDRQTLAVDSSRTDETRALNTRTGYRPYVVGKNNIGRITFAQPSAHEAQVVQTLYYPEPAFGPDRLLEIRQVLPFTLPLDSEM